MLNQEKKYFGGIDGGLDADSADFAVSPNNWVNAENIRTLSTDNGATETVEAVGSTILRSTIQPSVNFITIGAAEDTANNRIIRFQYSIYGPFDKIVCYYVDTEIEYDVLLGSQVIGGFGFNKDFPIHSAKVVGNLLYWTDNLNQLRRINIDAGIKLNNPSFVTDVEAYQSPLSQPVITVIRKPPVFPLEVEKITDVGLDVNFLALFAGKFSYRYVYRDYEESVLSEWSQLVPYNTKTDTFNAVTVSIPFSEQIEQDVQKVEIAVKPEGDTQFSIVKTWDKAISSDLTEIEDHNDGITKLSYQYNGNQVGFGLGQFYSDKPFDSVPRRSETIEVAQDRIFAANNLEGYNSPLTTSLTAELINQTEGAGVTGSVYKLVYNGGGATRYVIYITGIASPGYYRNSNDLVVPSDPSDYTLMTFISSDTTDVFRYYVPSWPSTPIDSFTFQNTINISNAPSNLNLVGSLCFKSGCPYMLAVQFYDFASRKSGIVKNGQIYNIPDRDYSGVEYVTSIRWSLNNTNALTEIPDWATHYSIVMTKCLRATFFLQTRTKNTAQSQSMTYVNRDASNNYTFATSAYASNLVGVGINITNLQNFGMGYVYAEGDIAIVHISGNSSVFRLKIIGQSAQWIICELENLGTLNSSTDALVEIYTPYQQSINENYFERGAMYEISNSGTDNRQYSVLNDEIRGDVTLLSRGTSPNDYLTENMSPNDTYYANWFTDAGRICIVDTIGEQQKINSISWSNVLIPGTKTNGLSSFDALDEKNIPQECGAIQKLQLTSKVQNEKGVVMLAICLRETASLYLGEVQLYGSTGAADVVQAPNIIGTINVLKGNFGTRNPESVIEFRGNVFWIDVFNGKIIQYSANGLFPISNYKMTRYWKQFCDQYNSMTTSEIEALGSRPFVYMAVDPHHWELLVTVPKLLSTPPKGYLPDYPSMVYPFDIWDGQAKTLVYKLNVEPNRWNGSYQMTPEGMIAMQNKLFSFKNGQLYENNSEESFCEFYGVQYKPRIMFVCNQEKAIPKTYNNISINGSQPSFVYFRSEIPYVQASDLENISFSNLEGNYYAVILRNKIIPTSTGFVTTGLLTGEKLKTTVLRVMIEWVASTNQINLNFVSIGYQLSAGHINFKRQ